MKFKADHDYHIHSFISPCSSDAAQNPQTILEYGVNNGFSSLCLTDHAWDKNVECGCPNPWLSRGVDLDKIRENLPLPVSDKCRMYFGCETDMNRFGQIGITKAEAEKMDFIVLSVSHLHLSSFTVDPLVADDPKQYKDWYFSRLMRLFGLDLPLYKTGISHFTTNLVYKKSPSECIGSFTDEELHAVFENAAKNRMGVELNVKCFLNLGENR
ncbi:MAG: PHP domain-containing protein, partial [Acutalibacteraceae bacterium]